MILSITHINSAMSLRQDSALALTGCAHLVFHLLYLHALSQLRVERRNLMCHPLGSHLEILTIMCRCDLQASLLLLDISLQPPH